MIINLVVLSNKSQTSYSINSTTKQVRKSKGKNDNRTYHWVNSDFHGRWYVVHPVTDRTSFYDGVNPVWKVLSRN